MKEKNRISTLFLDIGGVLLSNGWGHDFRRLAAKKFLLDISEMETRHHIVFDTYEEGRMTLAEYLDRVVFYQERHFTPDQFRDFMFSLTSPHPEMIAFIKKMKEQYGLKIIAVSNEARELNAYRIEKFDLNSIIDFFISSCYVHLRKPDAAIFKIALDISHVSADEVVYIDDVQLFVDVATDLGISSVRHINCSSTTRALAAMGMAVEKNKIVHAG